MYVCGGITKTPNYDGIIEISVCGAIILIPNYDSVICIVEIYRYMYLSVLSCGQPELKSFIILYNFFTDEDLIKWGFPEDVW
jgi:hypothetical protein